MLQHPTIDRLRELGLDGMAKSLRDLAANPEGKALDHMEWLGILLEHEMTLRQQKRFEARARTAKLRHLASVEDIDYRAARGLDRTLFLKLAGCDWIREHRHCLLTGPCGVGKSWLACALGFKACRENLSVLYQRVPRLFALLALGRGDGRYAKLMRQPGRVDLLILDDWGPEPLLPEQRSAGDRRGSLQRWLADHHQPASGRPLVRTRGKSHSGRRHSRSHRLGQGHGPAQADGPLGLRSTSQAAGLGWAARGGHAAPRIHDLRHTFICRRARLWHEHGTDIDNAMVALSTYVGHAKISDTYWYLTAAPDLMSVAGHRFEQFVEVGDA